jgi:PASTA domain
MITPTRWANRPLLGGLLELFRLRRFLGRYLASAILIVAQGSGANLSSASQVAVPSVVGLSQEAATKALTGAGLTVGTLTHQNSTTVANGSVISQHPVAGSSAVDGSPVSLVISQGTGLPSISFQPTTTSLKTTSNGKVTFRGTLTNNSGTDLNATDLFFNFSNFNSDSATPSQDLGITANFLITNGSTSAVVDLFEVRLGSVPAGSSFQIQVQLEDTKSDLSTVQTVLVSTSP